MQSSYGVDVGGTDIKLLRLAVAADDAEGGTSGSESESVTSQAVTSQAVTNQTVTSRIATPRTAPELLAVIASELEKLGRDKGSVDKVAVALPGWLDGERRMLERCVHLPFLEGVPLVDELESLLGRAPTLDADSNAGAIGEARMGAGRGASRVLYIAMGTGVGAALSVDGAPARVSHHTVGHISEIPLGPNRTAAQLRLGAKSLARVAAASGFRTLEETDAAAAGGDDTAIALWDQVGQDLGELLSILVPLFAPERVVLGGGLSRAAPHFIAKTRSVAGDETDLRIAEHTPFSGALGAAAIAARA